MQTLLQEKLITNEEQRDLDRLGIAKNAREEKLRARDARLKQAEDERMAKLYRQVILKEPAKENFVSINSLAQSASQVEKPAENVAEPVAGD